MRRVSIHRPTDHEHMHRPAAAAALCVMGEGGRRWWWRMRKKWPIDCGFCLLFVFLRSHHHHSTNFSSSSSSLSYSTPPSIHPSHPPGHCLFPQQPPTGCVPTRFSCRSLGLFAQRNQLSNWKVTRQVIKCIYFPDAFVLIRLSIHRPPTPSLHSTTAAVHCSSVVVVVVLLFLRLKWCAKFYEGRWWVAVVWTVQVWISWTVLILMQIQMNRIITTQVLLLIRRCSWPTLTMKCRSICV